MRHWNGAILVAIILLLPVAALGADQEPAKESEIEQSTPTRESVCAAPEGEVKITSEDPRVFVSGCPGQKQYDCTWPQSNCETALGGPGIDCSTIGKVCARVYFKDSSTGCCSTLGAFECIPSSSCTPGGWWLNCGQLCPC